jgi:hypothetical protein
MAATYTTASGLSRSKRQLLDFDPDATSATLVDLNRGATGTCVPLGLYRRFVVGVMHSVGTGAITLVEIIAATAVDGTGATVVTSKAATTADAVGDTVWIEADASQVKEVLATATHVGVRITLATATDECVVMLEQLEPIFEAAGLTADDIS